MDDASLDEFVDGEDERSESSKQPSGEERPASGDSEDERSESSESASGEGRSASGTGSDADDDPEGVAPAASTYAWTGDGAVCGACGESAERRWRDGDDLVCADCKEW